MPKTTILASSLPSSALLLIYEGPSRLKSLASVPEPSQQHFSRISKAEFPTTISCADSNSGLEEIPSLLQMWQPGI